MKFYGTVEINLLPASGIQLGMQHGKRQKTVPSPFLLHQNPTNPMKINASLRRHLAAVATLAALTLSGVQAQTSATTDPVGFVTMAIAGGGTQAAPKYTFTTLGLLNAVALQSTTTSVGGSTTLVDANATWTDNLYNSTAAPVPPRTVTPPTHFVEIVSGPGAGTTYDILATNDAANSLTLGGPLLAGIVSGASYKIRPHRTIATVFGATNQNGLNGATNSGAADGIQVYRNGGFVTYYYSTGGLAGIGWRQFGLGGDASADVIYPDDGLIIQRKQAGAVNLVISGAVKTGQSSLPVVTGYSLLGNVYAAGMTFGSSGLYTANTATGVAPGNGGTTGDQVLIWNPATSGYRTFFYGSGGLVGTGWKEFGVSGAATDTAIPVGAALFIKRAGAPFNWVAPQHPASFN